MASGFTSPPRTHPATSVFTTACQRRPLQSSHCENFVKAPSRGASTAPGRRAWVLVSAPSEAFQPQLRIVAVVGDGLRECFVESAVERDVVGDDGANADGLPQVSPQRGQTDLLR